MGDLEFAKVHNSAIFLENPPATYNDLKFIVEGLKKCCLEHALTTRPTIYQNLIKQFWRNAVVKKDDKDEKYLKATIQGKKIQVSERIIRESLQIDDKLKYSMEIDVHQTQDVLDHMGYEGTFPPTIEKLLPPCWKYLAHVFVSCISGRRSSANEISLVNIGAITALASGIEFNFSKFILHELVLNIEGNKLDIFLMYPRFLQIIFNAMHPELQRGNETLDLKFVGPSAFGLMKKKRGGKFILEGKFPLIKFGIFAKGSDQSHSEDQSIPTKTEGVVISTSKPKIEEVHVSPIVVVAEDRDQLHHVEVETQIYEEYVEDLNDDVEFLKEIDFTRISDDIPTNIELDLDDDEFCPLSGFDSNCFGKVNEVASSATKTGEDSNVLKILLSSSNPLEIPSGQRDVNSEIPPSVSTISTSASLIVEPSQPQIS
ncbi:unnamed protein product [Lactuca saligna]|uniref:Uncharacterized protein n=1 Tax=Lactuca saligna TaxID=75948 RepID=A0AA35YX21_LACSI|nr:unnamed protein product [Lactuca saligna]